MKASFLRFAFQTRCISGDVGHPGAQVLSSQQKQGTRGWRETCNGEDKYASVRGKVLENAGSFPPIQEHA